MRPARGNHRRRKRVCLPDEDTIVVREVKAWARLRRISFLSFLIVAWLLNGCATYHPAPLTASAALHALSPPDMAQVRLRAAEIKHPLLRPVPFDERDGLSPDEAAILAVIANPALRAVRDRKGVAAAQLLQAGILPNPQLSYSFETPIGGNTTGRVNALGLGLDWDITSLITRNARMDAARAHAASVDLGAAWQEWQAAEAAKLHVYRLSMARKRRTLAERREGTARQTYDLAVRAVAIGEKTAADLSEAGDRLRQAKSAVAKARAKVEEERFVLNRALGLPPGKAVTLERDIRIPFIRKSPSSEELSRGIQERRLDLLAFRQGYESQEARVRTAIWAQFPKIGIGFSGARDTDAFETVGLGVTVSLPLFDRNQGRIALERATRKQLFDEYTARLFEARAEIARLVRALRAPKEEIANLDAALSGVKEQAAGYRKAVDEGRVPAWTYYLAMDRLYAIRIRRLDLEERLVDLGVALEIASGRYSLFSDDSRKQAPGRKRAAGGSK